MNTLSKLLIIQSEENTYYSHANKKEMTLITNTDNAYYLTKGYFCCWECVLSYIDSVKNNQEFRESIQLLYQMFNECGGKGKITPSPHYTLKKEYGGPLSPEEYKSKHHTYQITNNHYIRMVPFGELFEVSSKY